MNANLPAKRSRADEVRTLGGHQDFVTMTIADQLFGIPVLQVQDVLGHQRALAPLAQGDLLAIKTAGAYGMSMSSNYNTRPRIAEVLVDGNTAHLVRRREEIAALFSLESVLP